MSKLIDLIGKRFSRLVVLKKEPSSSGKVMWKCKCDCGQTIVISGSNLKCGHTKSCGCFKSETKAHLIHGKCQSRLYHIWCSMKRRCYAVSHKEYKYYGGRGIRICIEWLNNFVPFYEWAVKNGYAEDLTIDRIDNDGNYEPKNCQWISLKENVKKAWGAKLRETGKWLIP
jgi:hypothetical protein